MKKTGALALAALLSLSFVTALNPFIPSAYAAATLVQQGNNGYSWAPGSYGSVQVGVFMSVTSGDVLVVGAETPAVCGWVYVVDTIGTSFTLQVTQPGPSVVASIYTATLSRSYASDGIWVVCANPPADANLPLNNYVYKMAGVKVASAATGVGTGTGTAVSTSSVSYPAGAFLVGMMAYSSGGGPATAGSGFTLTPEGSDTGFSNAQFATTGESASSSFPATLTGSVSWAEAAIALSPATVTTTVVSCTPSPVNIGFSTMCTATVTGNSPSGNVSFSSSSGTGTFTPSNGQCTLASGGVSGSCSVIYSDNTAGRPTITGDYSGDSNNTKSFGTFSHSVTFRPPPPPQNPCQYGGGCFTSFLAFNVTSGGTAVNANVTILRTHGPTQTGSTEVGSALQLAWYDITIHDAVSYTVTLPNGHTVTGTVSNPEPWTLRIVNISG